MVSFSEGFGALLAYQPDGFLELPAQGQLTLKEQMLRALWTSTTV